MVFHTRAVTLSLSLSLSLSPVPFQNQSAHHSSMIHSLSLFCFSLFSHTLFSQNPLTRALFILVLHPSIHPSILTFVLMRPQLNPSSLHNHFLLSLSSPSILLLPSFLPSSLYCCLSSILFPSSLHPDRVRERGREGERGEGERGKGERERGREEEREREVGGCDPQNFLPVGS